MSENTPRSREYVDALRDAIAAKLRDAGFHVDTGLTFMVVSKKGRKLVKGDIEGVIAEFPINRIDENTKGQLNVAFHKPGQLLTGADIEKGQ